METTNYQEWVARIGKRLCVTVAVVGDRDTHTACGEIVTVKGNEVYCRQDDGQMFAFLVTDIADVANWRGTILVKLK